MNPVIFLTTVLFITGTCSAESEAGTHQDERCVCKCPDISTINVKYQTISDDRSVYINSSVSPQDCDCPHVVLPHVNITDTEAESFCPRCKCSYQRRNLTVIKVVVILVIWVTCILMIYMLFLTCLDPILNRRTQTSYREQHNADEDSSSEIQATPMRTYGTSVNGVFNGVRQQQSRWKKQVELQRRNIYDRHSMLN